jgi:molecular chaperone DnaK (HSP70)
MGSLGQFFIIYELILLGPAWPIQSSVKHQLKSIHYMMVLVFDFYSIIIRDCFEELNSDLFEKALHDGEMNKTSSEEIVLVGSSTHIRRIQQDLKEF